MRKVLQAGVIAIVIVGVFFGFPLVYEHTGTTCVAFEKRLLAAPPSQGTGDPERALAALRAAFMSGLQHLSDGSVATEVARQRHPDWSPRLACGVEYWRSLVAPEAAKQPAS
jgi:hypothetical protein